MIYYALTLVILGSHNSYFQSIFWQFGRNVYVFSNYFTTIFASYLNINMYFKADFRPKLFVKNS